MIIGIFMTTVSNSEELGKTIERAKELATSFKHEHITLEHLLLALIEDQDALAVLRACDVDPGILKSNVTAFLENEKSLLAKDVAVDAAVIPTPTKAFHDTIERARIHVMSAARDVITGANVLVAIFSMRESHAVYYLQEQDMTRFDAVNFVAHGIARKPLVEVAPTPEPPTREELWADTPQRWQAVIDSASPDDYIEFVLATSLEDREANEWLSTAWQIVMPFGKRTDEPRQSLDASVLATLTAQNPTVQKEILKIQQVILDHEGIIIQQNGHETLFALKRDKLDSFKAALGLTSIQANRVLAPERNGFAAPAVTPPTGLSS